MTLYLVLSSKSTALNPSLSSRFSIRPTNLTFPTARIQLWFLIVSFQAILSSLALYKRPFSQKRLEKFLYFSTLVSDVGTKEPIRREEWVTWASITFPIQKEKVFHPLKTQNSNLSRPFEGKTVLFLARENRLKITMKNIGKNLRRPSGSLRHSSSWHS